jgi:diguanylate cyclase (GGDEF)-like protein
VLETIVGQAGVVLEHARLSSSEVALMSRDPLTGLLSRQGGLVVLAAIPAPYTVALIDVDSLKSVNAEAGSRAGDDVLRRLARALSQGRFGDVVVRWSGEEFLVALPGATPEGAGRRLERVLEEAEKSLWIGRRPVTFSCGIATVTDEGLDKGLGDADRALFFAKKQGGGRVALADHC